MLFLVGIATVKTVFDLWKFIVEETNQVFIVLLIMTGIFASLIRNAEISSFLELTGVNCIVYLSAKAGRYTFFVFR